MWRYARARDSGDADTYASLYTPDGQFSAGPNATKGREALKKMMAPRPPQEGAPAAEKRPPMYHKTANEQVRFTNKGHARIDAYYITMFGAAGQGTPRASRPLDAASTSWSA
jgi:SnoaL-like protein